MTKFLPALWYRSLSSLLDGDMSSFGIRPKASSWEKHHTVTHDCLSLCWLTLSYWASLMCPITSLLRMTSALGNFPVLGANVSLLAHPTGLLAMPYCATVPVADRHQQHYLLYISTSRDYSRQLISFPIWGSISFLFIKSSFFFFNQSYQSIH